MACTPCAKKRAKMLAKIKTSTTTDIQPKPPKVSVPKQNTYKVPEPPKVDFNWVRII